MTLRRTIQELLAEPRTASSLARELGIARGDMDDELRHALRSARAAGHVIEVEPAACRSCGFTFGEEKLSKPGRCPECRGSRIYEARLRVVSP